MPDLRGQLARELAKGGIALPDSKRLAVAMGTELHEVPAMLEIAERSELVERGNGGWIAADSAAEWLELPIVERWLRLSGSWLATLPAEIRDTARLVFTAHSVPVSADAAAGPPASAPPVGASAPAGCRRGGRRSR